MELEEAFSRVRNFHHDTLTDRIASVETTLAGAARDACAAFLVRENINQQLWEAAATVKRAAGQINVLIHGIGILLALPHILDSDERIESLSLGAGNTGKAFDLVTDRRLAEFSFIDWRGGSEAIRQNAVFEDFYRLAEATGGKARFLFVKNTQHVLHFLKGRRALDSVLSRNHRLRDDFHRQYDARFATVGEYFQHRCDCVSPHYSCFWGHETRVS